MKRSTVPFPFKDSRSPRHVNWSLVKYEFFQPSNLELMGNWHSFLPGGEQSCKSRVHPNTIWKKKTNFLRNLRSWHMQWSTHSIAPGLLHFDTITWSLLHESNGLSARVSSARRSKSTRPGWHNTRLDRVTAVSMKASVTLASGGCKLRPFSNIQLEEACVPSGGTEGLGDGSSQQQI